jgi:hypothetical protein
LNPRCGQANTRPTDSWPSGRRRTPGKCVGGEPSRGFESLTVRHNLLILHDFFESVGNFPAFPGVRQVALRRRRSAPSAFPANPSRVSAGRASRSVCRREEQGIIREFPFSRASFAISDLESSRVFRGLGPISLLLRNRELNSVDQGVKFGRTGKELERTRKG